MNTITVRVPATSANCGPGFDVLGLAVSLYNTFTFTPTDASVYHISYEGLGADLLQQEDPKESLVIAAMRRVFDAAGVPVIYGNLRCHNAIPPARGLGSSATAIVAGLAIANALLENRFTREEILTFANAMEGHPDNVCPAIFGELCCSLQEKGSVHFTQVPIAKDLRFVAVVPEVMVSTHAARGVLPETISYRKAVENVGYVSLYVTAMAQGRWDLLSIAMQDHLHVPYRLPLIAHSEEVLQAGKAAGAWGTTISGSGSTLIAYCTEAAENVGQAMVDVFASHGIQASYYVLQPDARGYSVVYES